MRRRHEEAVVCAVAMPSRCVVCRKSFDDDDDDDDDDVESGLDAFKNNVPSSKTATSIIMSRTLRTTTRREEVSSTMVRLASSEAPVKCRQKSKNVDRILWGSRLEAGAAGVSRTCRHGRD